MEQAAPTPQRLPTITISPRTFWQKDRVQNLLLFPIPQQHPGRGWTRVDQHNVEVCPWFGGTDSNMPNPIPHTSPPAAGRPRARPAPRYQRPQAAASRAAAALPVRWEENHLDFTVHNWGRHSSAGRLPLTFTLFPLKQTKLLSAFLWLSPALIYIPG